MDLGLGKLSAAFQTEKERKAILGTLWKASLPLIKNTRQCWGRCGKRPYHSGLRKIIMKILGLNINISRCQTAGAPAVKSALSPSGAAWLRGEDLHHSTPTLCNAYEQVVWVYRAVNVLAEQVANIPFLFSRGERGRETLITTGPLIDFYNQPHPHMNRFQYWELRVMWLMLRGECFRVPIYEGGRLLHVLYLDPARVQHIVEGHELLGWRYTGLGSQSPVQSQVFLPEEVWFERLANPFNFWRGMSPLSVADLPARTDFAASAFMRGTIENNADTGLIVRSEQDLGDEQKEQILAALRDRKRMAGTADRPLFLWGVNEIVRPQLSSADLQFLENRKFSRAEICAAFGVPEEIITATDHAKYDVMQGARLNFVENRIIPFCSRLEAEEARTVRALEPKAVGWFDTDSLPVMQEARRARLEAVRTGFEMGVPFNDLNRTFDLGFKPLPWGDIGYLPNKFQPIGRTTR
jgi:HK97 family phage portal protein